MLIIGDKRFLNLEEAVGYLMSQREAGAGFNITGLYTAQEDILSPIEGSIYGIGEGPDYEYYLYKDATFKLLGNFKGPVGQTGLAGDNGSTGEKGKQGNKGIKGNDGATGAGIGTIDNLDLSTGEADVSYVDGIATIHNSGDIIYNAVTHEEILTDFQIPIEGKDGIIIEAGSTGKKIEVGIYPEIISDLDNKQNRLTAGDNITIVGSTISATQPDISTKQDKLTAGDNITIENNVISTSASDVDDYAREQITQLQENKQDILTAGSNITIENSVISASGGGGGDEVWDDVTSLFIDDSQSQSYVLYKTGSFELFGDIPLRITIELYSFSENYGEITGTIQLYVTTVSSNISLLTNTIYSQSDDSFTGILKILSDSILYNYGEPITESTKRPKILKVEKLIGVN